MSEAFILILVVILAPIMWFVLGGPHGVVLVVLVGFLVWKRRDLRARGIASWRDRRSLSASIVAAFLCIWGLFEVFDSYPGSWLDRMFFVEARAFEVDLKLTVDGEPVHLNRRIRCAHGRSLATYSFFTSAFHYAGIDSFGQQLKSGGAVLVISPDHCRGRGWDVLKESASGGFTSPSYLPLIGWMDNAKDPTVAELYIDTGYYGRPGARIKVESFGIRAVSAWGIMDGQDDFANFTYGKFGNTALTPTHPKSFKQLLGYAVEGKDELNWSQFEKLKELNKIEQLELIPISSFAGVIWRRFTYLNSKTMYRGNRYWPVRQLEMSASPAKEPVNYAIDVVVPMRLTGDVLMPSRSERDVLVFYPYQKMRDQISRCPKIKIGGEQLICPGRVPPGSNFIFDPKARILYHLNSIYQDWPVAR